MRGKAKVPFVNFGQQYKDHKEDYDKAIQRNLNAGTLILQKDVKLFEQELANFLGFKYAVALASGTAALTLGLRVLGTKKAFTTTSAYTFKATHEAIAHNGSRPEMVDIDDRRLAEDVDIPVHIEGMVADSDHAIMEDACQAIGAEGVGYSGHMAYSFYPAKILGGMGDGGAFVTNDREVADKVRLLRHHWQTDKDEEMGYMERLDNIKAAFLRIKLFHLPKILERRKEIADRYHVLEGLVHLPHYQEGRVWQDYVIEADDPKKLAKWLKDAGVETLGVGMTPPHIAQNTGKNLVHTEDLYSRMLRLPCNETLTNEQVDYVIDRVREFYVKS